jgi:putative transposase
LFRKQADYAAFEQVLQQAWERTEIRLLHYVIMPTHWHMVVWPTADDQLSAWAQWLTVTHARRWHLHHRTTGTGPIYQGRFKSFPIQENDHYFSVCRYVEQNPLRARLVPRAEEWRWSSLWQRVNDTRVPWLAAGPLPEPDEWVKMVNRAETEAELAALHRSVNRGAPFGEETWQRKTAKKLGLDSSLRPTGRPKKVQDGSKI